MLHKFALHVFGRLPKRMRRIVVRTISPTFTAGVQAVLLNPSGELLVVHTSYNSYWGLPGGLMDKNEQPHIAAVRETLEETGLRIELTSAVHTTLDNKRRHLNFAYHAKILPDGPQEPRAHPPEIIEVGWFALDCLPPLDPETLASLVAMGVVDGSAPQV